MVQIAAQVALTPATDTPQTALGLMPSQFMFGTASLTYTAVLGTLAPVSQGLGLHSNVYMAMRIASMGAALWGYSAE